MATWIIVILLAVIAIAVAGPLLMGAVAAFARFFVFIVVASVGLALLVAYPEQTTAILVGTGLLVGLAVVATIFRGGRVKRQSTARELKLPASQLKQMLAEAEEVGSSSFRHKTGIYIWKGPKGGLRAFPSIGRLRDFLDEQGKGRPS